jgi:hypothetical protein
MRKVIFQSDELLATNGMTKVKGGAKLPPRNPPPVDSLDGDETDKRNKRPIASAFLMSTISI